MTAIKIVLISMSRSSWDGLIIDTDDDDDDE